MIVFIPSLIYLIINVVLFKYVRSSSRRVHPLNQQQAPPIPRRDLYVIRHMIIMFCIFVGGWTPIYLYWIINGERIFNQLVLSILIFLSQLSVLFDIINLFISNHKLRKYLKKKFVECIRL